MVHGAVSVECRRCECCPEKKRRARYYARDSTVKNPYSHDLVCMTSDSTVDSDDGWIAMLAMLEYHYDGPKVPERWPFEDRYAENAKASAPVDEKNE